MLFFLFSPRFCLDANALRLLVRQRRFALPYGSWLLLAWLMLLAAPPASADLMLYPTRIVFEKNQRAAQLELVNNGQESATYRISLVNRRMSETGEFSAADSALPGEQFADALLRYSPRQVVLAPGVAQTVRISLRKPAELAEGEYRSHLQFDRLPEAKGASSIDAQGRPDGSDIGITLKALVGATIPVIVRHGETAASVTLTDLALLKPAPGQPAMLAALVQRSGNRSVYGDFTATFKPQGGAAQEVGKASGVAVYSPNAQRRIQLELKPAPGVALAHGTLQLTWHERLEAGGKLLAEAAIELP